MPGQYDSEDTTFRSLDGLRLSGTWTRPQSELSSVAVLVHGGGVDRNEGGFYTRLAEHLANSGIGALRFDFRGHGNSEGRQEELTLAGVANDIHAAVDHAVSLAASEAPVNVIGASFSGGVCALFAARCPGLVRRLVLLNPLLSYKKRFIDDKSYWDGDYIDDVVADELRGNGFVAHSPSFRLGRPLLNEVFLVDVDRAPGDTQAPTLFLHGTRDTFVPVRSSRRAVGLVGGESSIIEVDGAQHGFAVHDDPQYRDPQTQEWQAFVIRSIGEWLTRAGTPSR